jgi:hypothetical protein
VTSNSESLVEHSKYCVLFYHAISIACFSIKARKNVKMLFCVLKVCEKIKSTQKMLDNALLRVKKALVACDFHLK